MDRDTLHHDLKREPFRPFVVVSSGVVRYLVSSPDMAWLLKTRLLVALPPDRGDVPDRFAELSILHIAGIEELQPNA